MLLSYGQRISSETVTSKPHRATVGAEELVLTSNNENICGRIGISYTPLVNSWYQHLANANTPRRQSSRLCL